MICDDECIKGPSLGIFENEIIWFFIRWGSQLSSPIFSRSEKIFGGCSKQFFIKRFSPTKLTKAEKWPPEVQHVSFSHLIISSAKLNLSMGTSVFRRLALCFIRVSFLIFQALINNYLIIEITTSGPKLTRCGPQNYDHWPISVQAYQTILIEIFC